MHGQDDVQEVAAVADITIIICRGKDFGKIRKIFVHKTLFALDGMGVQYAHT